MWTGTRRTRPCRVYLSSLDQETIDDINTVRNWNKTDLELEWEVAKMRLRPYDQAWKQIIGDSPFYTELYQRWTLLDGATTRLRPAGSRRGTPSSPRSTGACGS